MLARLLLQAPPPTLVFCNPRRAGLDFHHTGAAFTAAVTRAGVRARGRLSLHSLRHGHASMLSAQALNIVERGPCGGQLVGLDLNLVRR
jgi:hypothetical protein